jgi:hypothetical protein
LTVEQMTLGVAKLKRRIAELGEFDPQSVQMRRAPEVQALEARIDETLTSVFGRGTVEFNRYRRATSLDHGPVVSTLEPEWIAARTDNFGPPRDEVSQVRGYLAQGKLQAVALLEEAARGLEEAMGDRRGLVPDVVSVSDAAPTMSKIFVVHGHDDGAREGVARFMEKIGLETVILHEQPNQGRTTIEKFEAYAREVGFAVVLLTPDDLGGAAADAAQTARARQNVIFELGYFVGKLGRGRACLLRKGNVEIPSDLFGVVYTDMDAADGWKLQLARELKAAGFIFDANKVLA